MSKTAKEFIADAIKVHGTKYDYSKVDYKNSKIEIRCLIHGSFLQLPYKHLQGQGCPKCSSSTKRLTTEQFISKATKVHGSIYDYSLVVYTNSTTKVNIICSNHGVFFQSPYLHLQGNKCPKCRIQLMKSNTLDFIDKAKRLHQNKYSYDNTEYISSSTPVIITCGMHGDFFQRPDKHLEGFGCKKCNSSMGENKIYNWLTNNGIKNFITEHTFEDCLSPKGKKLRYDFYLPDRRLLIEYDGVQHFIPVNFGGNLSEEQQIQHYNTVVLHDSIKTTYATTNNYILLRINHSQNIEKVLQGVINNNKNV